VPSGTAATSHDLEGRVLAGAVRQGEPLTDVRLVGERLTELLAPGLVAAPVHDPVLKGFKDFLLRGNVVDLAVAVVIGAAFTAVVNQFADSFLTPLVNVIGGGGRLGGSFTFGGQAFAWGAFVSQVITFLATATIIYFLVVVPMHRLFERLARGEEQHPVGPTELELLVEIRDLLRAQQGLPIDPAAGRRSPPVLPEER
jgi:large conductance mechanosensitive channel